MIKNGKDKNLSLMIGSLPQVGSAMLNWFQKITLEVLTKTVSFGIVNEEKQTVTFKGVIQSLNHKNLELYPEGQRAFNWQWIHCEPSLQLQLDDIVFYNNEKFRVMARKEFKQYGYIEYHLCEDYVDASS